MQTRRVNEDDRTWIAEVVVNEFGSKRVVSRGRVYEDASTLDGFVVENDGRPVGCGLWYEIGGDAELVVLVTTYRGAGAGTALLDAVIGHARASGWKRLWLITTNDNVDALRMYQRAGWDWVGWYRDAVSPTRGR